MATASLGWDGLPGTQWLGSGMESFRQGLARGFVTFLSGQADPDLADFAGPPGDPGFSGPDSPVWEVHGDPSMFVGGIRALLFQAMHPLAMAGVAEFSNYRAEPLGRLQRTAGFIRDTTFGNTRRARAAIAMVRRVHRRVRGIAPDGRRFSATDPKLLLWVHAAEIDSFLAAHEVYGRNPLSPALRDRYVEEMAAVARRLGARGVPTSWAELQAYLEAVRPELHAGEQARDVARWLLTTPAHPSGWPVQAVLNAAAVALLPDWVRRDLGLVPTPWVDPLVVVNPLVIRPLAQVVVDTIGWILTPNPLREAATQRCRAGAGRRRATPARRPRRRAVVAAA